MSGESSTVSEGGTASLGAILKAGRLKRGWSLREAEKQTGIPNAHLSQIETGAIQQPSVLLVNQLAFAYAVPLPDLMEAGGYIDAEKYRARQYEERIRADERTRCGILTREPVNVTVTVAEYGDFGPIRTEDLPVTGKDGYGEPTPTVRELAGILRALPEQFQDLPVARYCDEGVAGISYGTSYHREESTSEATAHVRLW